jgi:hypothetical protein
MMPSSKLSSTAAGMPAATAAQAAGTVSIVRREVSIIRNMAGATSAL